MPLPAGLRATCHIICSLASEGHYLGIGINADIHLDLDSVKNKDYTMRAPPAR